MDWQAYWKLEPFGFDAWQFAQLLCMFYNANKKKGARKLVVEDFLPGGRKKQKGTAKQLISGFQAMVEDFQAARNADSRPKKVPK